MNSFMNYSVFFLQARLTDEDIFWETLNTIYDFYQENMLEIDQVIQALFISYGQKLDGRMTRKLVKFCTQRNIFSKTFSIVVKII